MYSIAPRKLESKCPETNSNSREILISEVHTISAETFKKLIKLVKNLANEKKPRKFELEIHLSFLTSFFSGEEF